MARRRAAGGRKAMTRAERDAFFRAAEAGPLVRYVLFRIAYETASRVTEVLHLRWGHVNTSGAVPAITVERIKGSETVTADVSDKLIDVLVRYWGDRSKRKTALLFPGTSRCPKRPRGAVRPRKGGMAWENCPGKHLTRRTVHRWVDHVGALSHLDPGLRHPHVFKHTRLCDAARTVQADGGGYAAMIAAVRQLSGHVSADALMVYLDDPEVSAKRTERMRREMEAF